MSSTRELLVKGVVVNNSYSFRISYTVHIVYYTYIIEFVCTICAGFNISCVCICLETEIIFLILLSGNIPFLVS